jgi:hypothetical protein
MITMPSLHGRVRAARQAAERARYLAYGPFAPGDRLRLLQQARELEKQAAALEREAGAGKPLDAV